MEHELQSLLNEEDGFRENGLPTSQAPETAVNHTHSINSPRRWLSEKGVWDKLRATLKSIMFPQVKDTISPSMVAHVHGKCRSCGTRKDDREEALNNLKPKPLFQVDNHVYDIPYLQKNFVIKRLKGILRAGWITSVFVILIVVYVVDNNLAHTSYGGRVETVASLEEFYRLADWEYNNTNSTGYTLETIGQEDFDVNGTLATVKNISIVNASLWKPLRCSPLSAVVDFKGTFNRSTYEEVDYFSERSHVCLAAYAKKITSKYHGGCFACKKLLVENSTGPSTYMFQVTSIPFNEQSHCQYHLIETCVVNILFLFVLLMFSPSKRQFYWTMMVLGFWYVALVSQSRHGDDWIQHSFSSFIGYVFMIDTIFRNVIEHTMYDTQREWHYVFESFFLFLVPYFVALHLNYATTLLPVTISKDNMSLDPSQICLLVMLIVLVAVLVSYHARLVFYSPYAKQYGVFYSCVFAGMIGISILASDVAELNFHLHHYQLALILLPLTAFRTRVSIFTSSILLGIFTNGIAGWGIDSGWIVKDFINIWKK